MPIFQDSNGLAIKFFIQKDIPQEIQAELCETITSLGGRVEVKVPRQGFLLVQPQTSEQERLHQCWMSMDRPDRFMVPYTYVEACKIAGMLLRQIFMENGSPIPMHIHPSIANPNARSALASRILHSGGDPDASMERARIILADPNTEVFQHLIKTYQNTPGKHIESYLWVKKCIEKSALVFTPVVYKNPGGRRPGEERTQFTEADEEHLCEWIAQKIPYKETGGRTGNRLYQQLCEQTDPEYSWVSRHTWQSWRERYKKNASRLDVIIARIVEEKRPAQGQQGQYGYVRQPEEKPKRQRKKRFKNGEDGEEDEGFSSNNVGDLPSMPVMPMPVMHSLPPMMGMHAPHSSAPPPFSNLQAPHDYPGVISSHTSFPMPPPAPPTPASKSQDEEEMEDNEESEWAVRVGTASPPTWGKRKADALEDKHDHKRQKTSEGMPEMMAPIQVTRSPSVQTTFNTSAFAVIASMHVIDQTLREIAKDFRFTLEEVQEFYDKSGDMSRTKRRFQRMRDILNEKFANDNDE
ncbi:hypothetical protein AGABI1DRAFT_117233 [Agaricus bisporus var. burnettii JB137-S8]|uniref:DNA-binding protein RAP1 n=1 Tax=Agaricus bisporus var. burnettii (strain JB137-S8 / ATCC MYA-4627 / FGSC 10392) TaxID=597362 RepID=K5XJQ6_AGABU|nr:uncharacterized protein AGABI1DRAFT_117233 [Agaricus bisporus var. burnettii JB137-S8]EKM83753.1 hypothetical protein AGABI1DRAFT_117233 [Agaricus bisporus var. burnettii JB137-S8]